MVRLVAILAAVTPGAISVQLLKGAEKPAIADPDQARPICAELLKHGSQGRTQEAAELMAVDSRGGGGHLDHHSLALELQRARREVLHLGRSRPLLESAILQPPDLSSRAHRLQADADSTNAGVEQHKLELYWRVRRACKEVAQLGKALNASQSTVFALKASHSTAHNLSNMENYELAKERSISVPLPASLPQVNQSTFDIVVNAFKRDMELEFILRQYLNCSQGFSPVARIHVVWNDAKREIPSNLTDLTANGPLEFFIPPTVVKPSPISSRFWPLDFTSEAVFHTDDDVVHTCDSLNDMFQIWKTDVDGIVGASPRWLDLGNWTLDNYETPLQKGEYNIIFVTKGAFVHRRFFDEFWKPFWRPIRRKVDDYTCGEDILFSAMHLTLVGPDHVYCVAGTVNHGRFMLMEGKALYDNFHKEVPDGLSVQTWKSRGILGKHLSKFLRQNHPEKCEAGVYSTPTKKFWRSSVHTDLTCRQLPLACFNRDWPECWQECGDDPVRGSSVCFRGDGACFAGMGSTYGKDMLSNTMTICVNGTCLGA